MNETYDVDDANYGSSPQIKLREAVFRKMGWKQVCQTAIGGLFWYDGVYWDSSIEHSTELPPIEEQWEVTAKYLIPFMKARGWNWHIVSQQFSWEWRTWEKQFSVDVKNNNIAHAACVVFRYGVEL